MSVDRVPRTRSTAVRAAFSVVHMLTCQAAYQGSNPISDIFSKWALEQTVKYLPRILKDPHGDEEARAQMLYVIGYRL